MVIHDWLSTKLYTLGYIRTRYVLSNVLQFRIARFSFVGLIFTSIETRYI